MMVSNCENSSGSLGRPADLYDSHVSLLVPSLSFPPYLNYLVTPKQSFCGIFIDSILNITSFLQIYSNAIDVFLMKSKFDRTPRTGPKV